MKVLNLNEAVKQVEIYGWQSVAIIADDCTEDQKLGNLLKAHGVQVLHLAPGCLTEQDKMDGYIYGLDCQDAKFMNLGPNEFVLSPNQLKADVVPCSRSGEEPSRGGSRP